MMRDIKFRVWMPHSDDIKEHLEINNEPVVLGEMYYTEYKEYKRTIGFVANDDMFQLLDSRNPPKLEWMQYTGLKDKNGVEIYERDIVRHERYVCTPTDYHTGESSGYDGNYIRTGHVTITTSMGVTLNGRQVFEPEDEHTDYMPSLKRRYNQNPCSWGDHAEVIGNIYENPELLRAE